ncbi:TPA: hypothetical protein ACXYRX_002976 [Escherichia coli]
MITAQYSDIVLGKVDSSDAGYNFKEMEITLTEHHHAGTVVTKDGSIANQDGSDAYGVLVDRALIPDSAGKVHLAEPLQTGQKYKLVVAVRGVTFAKDKLLATGGAKAAQAVLDKLEALGNKVQVQTLGDE